MDGFKNRLSGRYEKGSTRDNRYDRSTDNRYDRLTKKTDSISIEAISDAIEKSNKSQLGEIEKLLAGKSLPQGDNQTDKSAKVSAESPVLARLERMASQANEALNENEEAITKTYEMVRAQTDMIIKMGGSVEALTKNNPDSPSEDEDDEKVLEAISDNRALLNLIRQELHTLNSKEEEEVKAFDAVTAEKKFNDLSDHVHIQCVKTFRNIQAKLTDQTTEITNQVKSANNNLFYFVIASVCLNVVTLVLVICEILKIFG